jgi:hypothetical protein
MAVLCTMAKSTGRRGGKGTRPAIGSAAGNSSIALSLAAGGCAEASV